MEASVCTAVCRPLPIRTCRLSALTIPAVTVPASPSGDPTASTGSPTRVEFALASGSGGSPAAAGTLSTARSLAGSRPTTSAGKRRPSEVSTVTAPAPPRARMWSLVTMCCSLSMAKPEPDADAPERPPTITDTTPGTVLPAAVTSSAGTGAADAAVGPGES